MTRGWLLLIAIGVAVAVWLLRPSTRHRVGSENAHELVRDGARLVDVRTREEYRAGHLPGAVNIPVQELGSRVDELEPRGTPIVVYCRSGRRSATARAQLVRAGFTNVHDLGPMSAW